MPRNGRSDEEQEPFWANSVIPAARDLSLLRPASLPKGQRFETLDDAQTNSKRLEGLLAQGRQFDYGAEVLKECRAGYYICGKPFCPLCARRFRRWLFSESIRIASKQPGEAAVINVLFETCDIGELSSFDPLSYKDRLRNQLNRAGFDNVVAVGGIEAALQQGRWVLHAHVLTIAANAAALGKGLRKYYKDVDGLKKRLVVQSVADPTKQQSYLLKFHTYTRLAKSRQAVPLKAKTARDLVGWLKDHSFEDFLFLKGLRRRGAKLRPT